MPATHDIADRLGIDRRFVQYADFAQAMVNVMTGKFVAWKHYGQWITLGIGEDVWQRLARA